MSATELGIILPNSTHPRQESFYAPGKITHHERVRNKLEERRSGLKIIGEEFHPSTDTLSSKTYLVADGGRWKVDLADNLRTPDVVPQQDYLYNPLDFLNHVHSHPLPLAHHFERDHVFASHFLEENISEILQQVRGETLSNDHIFTLTEVGLASKRSGSDMIALRSDLPIYSFELYREKPNNKKRKRKNIQAKNHADELQELVDAIYGDEGPTVIPLIAKFKLATKSEPIHRVLIRPVVYEEAREMAVAA